MHQHAVVAAVFIFPIRVNNRHIITTSANTLIGYVFLLLASRGRLVRGHRLLSSVAVYCGRGCVQRRCGGSLACKRLIIHSIIARITAGSLAIHHLLLAVQLKRNTVTHKKQGRRRKVTTKYRISTKQCKQKLWRHWLAGFFIVSTQCNERPEW